ISSERSFAGVSVSLPRAKTLAKASGGKLNDVVLALSSGVVRRYLISKGGLPAKSLTAAVPISLREEGNADSNNQVFGMICSIATHGIALNITVQSYRDQLDFGFIAGANIIPHVQVLCDMLPEEFDALEAAYAPPSSEIKGAAAE